MREILFLLILPCSKYTNIQLREIILINSEKNYLFNLIIFYKVVKKYRSKDICERCSNHLENSEIGSVAASNMLNIERTILERSLFYIAVLVIDAIHFEGANGSPPQSAVVNPIEKRCREPTLSAKASFFKRQKRTIVFAKSS